MSSSDVARGRRILALVIEAYGGHGGVALYGLDVLDALAEDPSIDEIVVLPRAISNPVTGVPGKTRFDESAAGGTRAYLRAVLRHLRRGRYDLIYCGHINLAPLAWIAAQATRAPWLLTVYGIDAWKPAARRTANFAARHADHIIALSEVTRRRFLSWCRVPEDRTSVLHNAIRLEQFGMGPKNAELVRRYGLEGRKVVMTLGRMDPSERYKGFDEIIDLIPRLAEKVPEIAYLIAGDGADRPRIEGKVVRLGLEDRVVFTGRFPEEEKADLYRLADVYAMPSYGEGFGFVTIEAMACGVPAIASTQDGGREAVREGMIGRLVNPHDPDDIERAILGALAEEKNIPEGLNYFAFPNFAKRMQVLADRVMERS